MADKITLNYTGADILAALRRLHAGLGSAGLRPALAEIGEELAESTRQRFSAGRAPDGEPWAENEMSTLLGKRGAKPLINSGLLAEQIFWRLAGDGVEIGSAHIYAGTQQFGAEKGQYGRTARGAPIPWGDIPARPFLGLSAADEQAVLGILGDYIAELAGGGEIRGWK